MVEQALETAGKIESDYSRTEKYTEIALLMVQKSLLKEALKLSELCKYHSEKIKAAVADRYLKMGNSDQAMALARGILRAFLSKDLIERLGPEKKDTTAKPKGEEGEEKATVVIRRLCKEGLFEKALHLARGIPSSWEKVKAIAFIASAKKDEKLFEEALNIARKHNFDYLEIELLQQYGRLKQYPLLFKRAVKRALDTMFKLEGKTCLCFFDNEPDQRGRILMSIVSDMIDFGWFDLAIDIIQKAFSKNWQGYAFRQFLERIYQPKVSVLCPK